MSARILLVTADDPRRRMLEDLLADQRTVVRALPETKPGHGADVPWAGPAPELLVIGAFGRTGDAAELARVTLAAEPDLSVLVVDDEQNWPEALLALPGLAVTGLQARGGFLAARDRLLERRRLLREVAERREEPKDRLAAAALEAEVPCVREMRLMLERVAEKDTSIVLSGELGTLRLRTLRHLLRTQGDLGVDSDTVLVENIDMLSPVKQGSVLRLAQAGRRIVATATTGFLDRARDGSFRSDLYYRLGGQPVVAPPLRQRGVEEVLRLSELCGLRTESERARQLLGNYGWPGNLRELELTSEHALMLADGGPVDERHIPLPELAWQQLPSGSFVLRLPESGASLEAVEREAIRQTLEAADSNVAEAARRLAVDRGKLRYRLRRYGLGK
ncbi:MAG: AAA-type ATPase lid domain-containing protein [Planctomycetota bacterium]|jgi:DNA-binding NtrC family response regulator